MNYTKEEVLEYIKEDDVRFVRLAFCDINGRLKNMAILPEQLERAFDEGISFDASAIEGFTDVVNSDLFLFPIPQTLTVLPWRSFQGKVVRMFCEIRHPDGTVFENDSRAILKRAEEYAKGKGYNIKIGTVAEFYLFKTDINGEPTKIPFDNAGYMDVSPADKGENIRREICQTMKAMNIIPESSHHEEGPGQNEVSFHYDSPLRAADNVINFKAVVRAAAEKSGLIADFTPKPLADKSGNGFHINVSLNTFEETDDIDNLRCSFMAGVLAHAKEMTYYFNHTKESYDRLGKAKAPKYITWSPQNRSQFIRVPAVKDKKNARMELRSPDPYTNPYLAFALIIYAGIDGIEKKMVRGPQIDVNLYTAPKEVTDELELLPQSLEEAKAIAENSEFIKKALGR